MGTEFLVCQYRSEFERRYVPCPLTDSEIEYIMWAVDEPWVIDCMFHAAFGDS